MDGRFAPAKKGGSSVGKTKRGKGTKWMLVDGRGIPLGIRLYFASPSGFRLAEETLRVIRVGRLHRGGYPSQKPARMIADKGYDGGALRERLRRRGMTLIAPYRSNGCRTAPQEGRALRRYKKRRIVEPSNAWLGNFWRLDVRYNRPLTVGQAFVQVVCLRTVPRKDLIWLLGILSEVQSCTLTPLRKV